MKSERTLRKELALLDAMLCDEHPRVRFDRQDQLMLLGAAYAIRWALNGRRERPVSHRVVPRKRRVERSSH